MKVKALKAGFFGGSLRDVGEEFEVPEGTKSAWFATLAEYKAPVAAKAKAEPKTLSEIAKAPVKASAELA
jgi:hypothetical protein